MKKILAILLLSATIFSLASCSDEYKPVKSTKEEAKAIMSLPVGNDEYDVRYELYRAFFLTYRDQVDGGNRSVWSSANKGEYINRINELIIDKAATIYATLHFAESLGIDPYSDDFESQITETVRIGVEGNGSDVVGHDGDYDAYLESLKQMNLNYSVSTLLIRYELALEAINEYYAGRVDAVLGNLGDGYDIKEEDVRAYYYGEECARVLYIFYQDGVKSDLALEAIRSEMSGLSGDIDVALYIINHSMGLESELIKNGKVSGSIIGKYALNDLYYRDFTAAALALEKGKVSSVIKTEGDDPGSYILYKLEKADEHFTAEYQTIRASYIDNLVGKSIANIKAAMKNGVSYTKNYDDVEHSNISMD